MTALAHTEAGQGAGEGSLVDRAIGSVREFIRANDLKVGDALPGEGHFAATLGVSRAVMREAFGALAALRQIDVANGRRPRVSAMDGSVMASSIDHAIATAQVSVTEVWDVRRTLELRTAALAASNRSETDAAAITEAARRMASARDLDELTRADIAFHQAISRASGNALFHQIIRSFAPLMAVAVPQAWHTRETEEQRATMIALHLRLAAAIAAGDASAATAEMDRHFDKAIGDLMRSPALD